jgi:hypothetical protein
MVIKILKISLDDEKILKYSNQANLKKEYESLKSHDHENILKVLNYE